MVFCAVNIRKQEKIFQTDPLKPFISFGVVSSNHKCNRNRVLSPQTDYTQVFSKIAE